MRKRIMDRLPFERVNGTSRAGRPRVPRVLVSCTDCGASIERRVTDVERDRARGRTRALCTQCWRRAQQRGMRPRREDTKIRELTRLHNGRATFIDYFGYVAIYEPTFSGTRRSNNLPNGYHYEHRVVAVKQIGRPLRRGEEVHHINGIKTDNRPDNLMVLTKQQHRKLHNDEIIEKLARLAEYERLDPVISGIARRTLGRDNVPVITPGMLINAERIRLAAFAAQQTMETMP